MESSVLNWWLCDGVQSMVLFSCLVGCVDRLDELMVREASLKLHEQLSEQEKNFTASQNQWLSEELKQKTDELLQLKKEKMSLLASLESTTAANNDEVSPNQRGLQVQRHMASFPPSQSLSQCFLFPSPITIGLLSSPPP